MNNRTFWLLWLSLALVGPSTLLAAPLDIAPSGSEGAGNVQDPDARARELLARGQAALAQNDLFRADRAFRHALEINPGLHEARQGYASSLVAAGRPMRAVNVLQNGLAIAPGHVPSLVQLAGIAADSGAYEVAINAIESVPVSAFETLEATALEGWLAALYLAAGDYPEAWSRYNRLSAAQPDEIRWVSGMAVSAEMDGRRDQAVTAWSRVAALEAASRSVRAFARERIRQLDDGNLAAGEGQGEEAGS